MSEKEEVSSDEGNSPLKSGVNESGVNKKSVKKLKSRKSTKKDDPSAETADDSVSSKENEKSEKSKPRKKSKYYVEVDEGDDTVPLLDQPTVVEGSRQRRAVIPLNRKAEIPKQGAIQIPYGKGTALGRIPTVVSRFKRLRLDEIKHLHRFMFGKLGNLNNLNNNILKFNGFTFTQDSPEYSKKLTALAKIQMSILREFVFFFDLDLKLRKKEDVVKAILDFLLHPKRAEVTVNPNIVSHPKRKATKRNYYEREIEEVDQKRQRKAKSSKVKETDATDKKDDESSNKKSTTKGKNKENGKVGDDESKENNAGADNTSELKKPAKKRKRNQVIEEQPEVTDDSKSKKTKGKETNDTSAISNESDVEENSAENLTDDELKSFLKKVLADANLEKTTMKTVYSLISKHYPNYNFSKKKDFIKDVVKSLIQT